LPAPQPSTCSFATAGQRQASLTQPRRGRGPRGLR
jgi:hypothetical protein